MWYPVCMPTRNIVKEYAEDSYYHVYNRGVNKELIFKDDLDYEYFLGLFKQRLSREPARDRTRRPVAHFYQKVELVAYCLMPNHYHLLLYLKDKDGIERLMRSVMTAYSGYFNRRHGRVGKLFQNHFLASRISSDAHLMQVSWYIHSNALDIGRSVTSYPYSSIRYFGGSKNAEWVHPERIVTNHHERSLYLIDLAREADHHELYHRLKHELAN